VNEPPSQNQPPRPPQLAGHLVDGRHVLPLRVYYEDTDFSGVVYHASYLRFMERGRSDRLRLIGFEQGDLFEATRAEHGQGLAFVVRAMQIEFLRAGRVDDVLEVWTWPQEVRGASLTLHQDVRRGAEVLVSARVKLACVAGGKAVRIPERLRKAMGMDLAGE
jgi:acyl-CoA thioester hydrolase